jgi:hypothetical protein
MNVTSITIGLPVTNLERAGAWYERCFELDQHIDPASDIREYQVAPGV